MAFTMKDAETKSFEELVEVAKTATVDELESICCHLIMRAEQVLDKKFDDLKEQHGVLFQEDLAIYVSAFTDCMLDHMIDCISEAEDIDQFLKQVFTRYEHTIRDYVDAAYAKDLEDEKRD